MSDNLTLAVARYAAGTRCEALPADVVQRAKLVVVDEIACACFGRRSLAGDLAARYAAPYEVPAEARIHATGRKVAAAQAALANGAAGHGEEVDGAHVVGGHPGASIVHAAVAMAERQRATGAELINAVVLGYDVGTRAVDACGQKFVVRDRFGLTSDFLYTLGATAACARLLGLEPQRLAHALALCTFQANGLYALYAEKRHVSKSLCNGQFASTAVSAALMSATGLEGHEDILGARHGVLQAWGAEGRGAAMSEGLGQRYAILDANFKMINAGYPIHAPVEAALALAALHAIRPDAIESIDVGMPSNALRVVDGRDMHNICVQDMLCAALVQGGLPLRDLPFPGILSNPAFARLRPRVTVRGHPDLDRDQPNGRGAIVTIRTAGGQSMTQRIEHPKGHSARGGLTWDDLATKWRSGLPECDTDRMMSIGQRLEHVDDVCELLDAFRPRA
jgi:2-methylcitrate dehydratase PrpD